MSSQPARENIPSPTSPCPCGSGRVFADCCEPILQQRQPAATAEALMRSRFTAHALGDFAHLHRTYLPTAGQPYFAETGEVANLKWTRLVVHSHEVGPKPETSFVDFSAYYHDEGVEHAVHERSEFRRINGGWLFARAVRDGPAPVKSTHPKVGRNNPCPCGSGKKYKHCCLQNA